MTPFERKVVHDAVAAVDGVHSESEGEDPRRRVVVFRQAVTARSFHVKQRMSRGDSRGWQRRRQRPAPGDRCDHLW